MEIKALATGKSSCWLDFVHPEYKANLPKWKFAHDHYTGDLLDEEKIDKYLIKRAIGESKDAYAERKRLVDHGGHFAQIADSLAGMVFAVEDDANRVWVDDAGRGLGQPDAPGTTASRLKSDADGAGSGWGSIWRRVAINLITMNRSWLIVGRSGNNATVTPISPVAITNWVVGSGGELTHALLVESVSAAGSLTEEAGEVARFTAFDVDGWQRYVKDRNGQPVALQGEGDFGSYAYLDRAGRRTIPLIKANLPTDRMVGYLMALRANVLLNLRSHLDNILRNANFPFLVISGSDEAYDAVVRALIDGSKVLQQEPGSSPHSYVAPPTSAAEVAREVLKDSITDFYVTSFREYAASSGVAKTATESRADVAMGVGAFLSLLTSALDDAENATLRIIAQTEFRHLPAVWDIARVERSREFAPADVQTVVDNTIRRVFGADTPVPLGQRARREAAMNLAGYLGVSVDEHEMDAALEMANIRQSIDIMDRLPVPQSARVALTIRLLEAAGILDKEGQVAMADGTSRSQRSVWEAEALQIASAQDTATVRAAEFASFGALGGGGGAL